MVIAECGRPCLSLLAPDDSQVCRTFEPTARWRAVIVGSDRRTE
jgi:hypothetical protein